MLNFRVRSMDVMAFLRNGINVGVAFIVVDSMQSVLSFVPDVHKSLALDADGGSQPLVDAILEFVIDESTLNGVDSINLNHLFNIWHSLLESSGWN